MNVKELRELLEKYPDDMEVLYQLYSDYENLKPDDISAMPSVNMGGYWMRSHPTMSSENKANEKIYLVFPGN